MKLFVEDSTISGARAPPETPMKTSGEEPKLTPSIAIVGLAVPSPNATAFEIINCGFCSAATATAEGVEIST